MPPVKPFLRRVRRQVAEAVGIDWYSRPALNGFDTKH